MDKCLRENVERGASLRRRGLTSSSCLGRCLRVGDIFQRPDDLVSGYCIFIRFASFAVAIGIAGTFVVTAGQPNQRFRRGVSTQLLKIACLLYAKADGIQTLRK